MDLLMKLTDGQNLTREEAKQAIEGMVSGSFTPSQTAGILIALKMKGETVDEICAFAEGMRAHAVSIRPNTASLLDTCGTGGDSSHTFNISTAAAIVAAGAGASVAKHGNRSVSSKCGSADVMDALGVKILQPAQVKISIEKIGFGFMFAPHFHPAMKNVAPIRKELGVRTIFNLLGPLTNPAGAQSQLIGVSDLVAAGKIAIALSLLGTTHALVVNSEGLDEISLGKTDIFEVRGRKINRFLLDAGDFGFENGKIPVVQSAQESANIILEVLSGKKGAARDVVLLNAGAALYVSGAAHSIKAGVQMAAQAVDSGKAEEKLGQLRAFSGE
jgi:anthranilate phosphoribosyltransferase